jgi:hypothetical protein
MTAVANTVFTAAQFNTNVRDNLNETAPAKSTTAGQIFVSTGTNEIAARLPAFASVATNQSTASTSYVDLATPGPSVTATTGTRAMVFIQARMENTVDTSQTFSSFAVSGASTIAASDTNAILLDGVPLGNSMRFGCMTFISSLTAGSNTFTMKYRVGANPGSFEHRHIAVVPMN